MKTRPLALLLLAGLLLAACSGPGATGTPGANQPSTGQFEMAEIQNDEGGTVTITGEVAYTNPFFTAGVAEPLVILEDQAGFVDRNRGYIMPPESQTMGQITSDFFTSPFTYSLSLPIVPQGGVRDVDQDGEEDAGVLVFAPAYWTNAYGDPFLEQRDLGGGGWSGAYVSTELSEDAATQGEYVGGKIIVYAADANQGFPSGFGADEKLFTEDDPIVGIPAGYTMVDMDTDPFTFDRSREVTMDLLEPEGAALDDFSALSYVDAFDAMIAMMREEYAFTELKGLDWDALNDEFRPRFQEATDNNDIDAYAFALRDFLWSIPDGHVGFTSLPVLDEQFNIDIATGLGMSIRDTSDGRVIVSFLTDGGPAEEAGIQLGAEIFSLNGEPISDLVDASVPWSSPFSTAHTRRLQQLRYAVRFPEVTDVEVTYQNPGGAAATATLTTAPEFDSFSQSSFSAGTTGLELPVEFEVMDNGYGYVAIYSFFDNELLSVQLWERMIETLNANGIPGLVIDLRNNGGGSGFLADQMAAYFFEEEMEIGTGAAWDESIQDFYDDPNVNDKFYPPPADKQYHGDVVVIVSPNCSSACEFFAHDMTILDRATIVGHYPTGGLGGSVKDFNMPEGVTVRFPIGRPLDLEGNIIIEDVGVVPDVVVPVTEETLFAEGDVLLEAAINILLGGEEVVAGGPRVDFSGDPIAALQSGVGFLSDFAEETYTADEYLAPYTHTYTVALDASQKVLSGFLWCAGTQEQLEDNWSKMVFTISLNGEEIPIERFVVTPVENGGLQCNLLLAQFVAWPEGEHTLVVDAEFTQELNDGSADYPPGHYRDEYTVTVGN
jgi:C-terminal processing protease CtpA/Prc